MNHCRFEGPPNGFGAPGPGSSLRDWVNYTRAYRRGFNADLVFIDGRSSVACGLNVLPLTSDETIVMCHDLTSCPYYFDVLKDYDLNEIADTSATLEGRKEWSRRQQLLWTTMRRSHSTSYTH
jgi:hypothetical protein